MLGDQRLPGYLSRQEEIVHFCLCVGHTCLTHSYRMNGEDVPKYLACDCDLMVEHILIESGDFMEVRKIYYGAVNIPQFFQKIRVTYVCDFLHEMGLLYRIW